MIFERDYQIRLNVRSAQPGHLYILNEGPGSAAPEFVFLFPSSTANGGSSLLSAARLVQIPQESWFKFDTQRGVEMVWLVFAEEEVPELEAGKEFASTRTGGLITDPAKNQAIQNFLTTHSAARPDVNRGELTTLKAPGPLLVYALRLEHH
jgi:hypothetical protein